MPVNIQYSVTDCSGEDAEHPVGELLSHSQDSRGWSTPRNCTYPQHLTLELDQPGRLQQIQLLSHEYKIAGKVEIQVASPKQSTGADGSRTFTRLGYLSFDSNERTQFSARELKSVSLPDVEAAAVRFIFHRCSPNARNVYSQVSVIMLNIVGDPLSFIKSEPTPTEVGAASSIGAMALADTAPPPPPPPPQHHVHQMRTSTTSDGDIDPVTAEHIAEFQARKAAAVAIEDYDEAKRLKAAVDALIAIGGKVAALEARKKAAVDSEDYDSAKALKAEIERMRMRAYGPILRGEPPAAVDHIVAAAASASGASPQHSSSSAPHGAGRAPSPVEVPPAATGNSPLRSTAPPMRATSMASPGVSPSSDWESYDERPARAKGVYDLANVDENTPPPGGKPLPLQKQPSYPAAAVGGEYPTTLGAAPGNPSASASNTGAGLPPPPPGFPQDLPPPEPFFLEDSKEAESLVAAVGEYLALCIYSRTWQLREAALTAIATKAATPGPVPELDSNGDALRTLCGFIGAGLKDRIPAVGAAAMNLLRALGTTPARRFPPRELHAALAELVPAVVERVSDSAPRTRDQALDTLKALASCKEMDMRALTPLFLRPCKRGELPRATLGRVQLVTALLPLLGVSHSSGEGFVPEAVMKFAAPALTSASAEVRAAASDLTLKLGGAAGADAVMALLPVDLNPKLKEQLECGLTGKKPPVANSRPSSAAAKPAKPAAATAMPPPADRRRSDAVSAHASAPNPRHRTSSAHGASTASSLSSSTVPPPERRPSRQGNGTSSAAPAPFQPDIRQQQQPAVRQQRASEPHRTSISAAAAPKPSNSRRSQPHLEPFVASPIPPQQYQNQIPEQYRHIPLPSPSPPRKNPLPLSPSAAMSELSIVDEDPGPFEQELRAREEALGPGHPAVAEAASNLAIIYNQKGEPHRALPLYERALAVWQAAHGPDHPDVAHALTDIAVIHLEAGRDEHGKVLLRRALEIQERVLGPQHPDVVAIRDVLEEDGVH